MPPDEQPNRWTTQQAAEFAEIPHRQLLDLLHRGLLPAIPVGERTVQNMGRGKKKRTRRVAKWIIPREAFIKAWQNFEVPRSVRRHETVLAR